MPPPPNLVTTAEGGGVEGGCRFRPPPRPKEAPTWTGSGSESPGRTRANTVGGGGLRRGATGRGVVGTAGTGVGGGGLQR